MHFLWGSALGHVPGKAQGTVCLSSQRSVVVFSALAHAYRVHSQLTSGLQRSEVCCLPQGGTTAAGSKSH